MDGDGEFEDEVGQPRRCPDDCPNAGAPYCPKHEDPAIYKRDESSLHLAEAFANNAARELIIRAIQNLRERRRLKEVRVPTRTMDEWIVFTKQVVLDSGEYTAQGEIERRVAAWLDKMREQDWDKLDRIKERYMRFTSDLREGRPPPVEGGAGPPEEAKRKRAAAARRPAKTRTSDAGADAEFYDDEY